MRRFHSLKRPSPVPLQNPAYPITLPLCRYETRSPTLGLFEEYSWAYLTHTILQKSYNVWTASLLERSGIHTWILSTTYSKSGHKLILLLAPDHVYTYSDSIFKYLVSDLKILYFTTSNTGRIISSICSL